MAVAGTLARRPLRLACVLAAVAALAAAAAPEPSMAAPTAASAQVQAQRARDAKVVPDIVDDIAPRRVTHWACFRACQASDAS